LTTDLGRALSARAYVERRCRGTRENDKGHFRIEIVPAGGTSAANY